MDHAQNFNACLWGKPPLNSILNGRGCHIIEAIFWTFLAHSAVLTAKELQQLRGRKAAWKAHKCFTFLMRLRGLEESVSFLHWILAPLPVLIMDILKTRLGGSKLLLRQHEELFPQTRLEAKSRSEESSNNCLHWNIPPAGYYCWQIAFYHLDRTG